jgi:hypothetical protein
LRRERERERERKKRGENVDGEGSFSFEREREGWDYTGDDSADDGVAFVVWFYANIFLASLVWNFVVVHIIKS